MIGNKNKKTQIYHRYGTNFFKVFLASVITSHSVMASDLVWQEDFESAAVDQKGITFNTLNMSDITKWSIDVSNTSLTATSDWFRVQNGFFEGRDLDGEAIWLSEVINVTGKENILLTLNVSEEGDHESSDYIDIAYAIDGGSFTQVNNWQGLGNSAHTLIDDFTHAKVSVDVAASSTIQVRVAMQNGASSEYLRLGDVTVTADIIDVGNPGGGDTISGACFNCPDLTKIADASQFNDTQYYADVISAINAGLSSNEIKEVISNTISTDHKKLSYSEVWTALTQTDEDPLNNSNVILIYKGNSIAKMLNGSGTQSSDPDNWNREHVWAKSHGFPSSSAHAYTDIHHLRPSDISVNSARGNLDFDFSDSVLSEAPANKVDSDSFEPRDVVKGDVARMIFYMDSRYQGVDGSTPDLEVVNRLTSVGEAKLGKFCVLMAWHQSDPVDVFEQTRNAKAYEFQGNRNPFIDHPEWVDVLYETSSCDTGGGDTGGGDTGGGTADGDLIISEYIEGSSYNKAIEIYNTSNSVVDLSQYQLTLYTNGSTQANTTYSLTGSLAPLNVFVIGHSSASATLSVAFDTTSSVVNFNGDDYLELTKSGSVIDTIGTFGIRTNWGKDVTLVRKPEIIIGDSNRNDVFEVANEWLVKAKDDFSFIGAHISDASNGSGPNNPAIGLCGDPATLIHTIQGSGSSSPLTDSTHTIEGVVTSVVPSLSGYFVQEEASDQDDNAMTSEAVFVYHSGITALPAVGQAVRVIGTVKEFYDRTQLSTTSTFVDCGITSAITPTLLSMPVNSAEVFESLEGMLVTSNQALSVTDTFDLAKYGQFTVSNGRLIKPTNVFDAGSAQALTLADKNSRNRLVVDDLNNSTYPEVIPFPVSGLSHINTLRLGDSVNGLTGILDYSFSDYKILPTAAVNVVASNARELAPVLNGEGSLKVASFNVLNYFNGPNFPTARGAHTQIEFERQSDKIVSAIIALDADIIGLMEIENDGFTADSAIAELVDHINIKAGVNEYAYVSYSQATLGNDAITVGMLYKPASVNLKGASVSTTTSPFDYGNRQPLAQTFVEKATGEELTVVVNHFKSKGSCGNASGNNADQHDGQGCWNELRTQAANSLVTWLASKPTGTTDDDVLVIGDLNAYGKEAPINAFTAQGFNNLVSTFGGVGAYSYSFGGEIGYLDHALSNSSLTSQVSTAYVWHINADEPVALDYNVEKKSNQQLVDYYNNDAFRASDHDPVIVLLNLKSQQDLVGDFDLDGDIDINDIRKFSSMIRAGHEFDLSYDFNGDGLVNSSDVRALMSRCTRTQCAA